MAVYCVTLSLPWAAAAALVGYRFGKHHVKRPLADLKKAWQGSYLRGHGHGRGDGNPASADTLAVVSIPAYGAGCLHP